MRDEGAGRRYRPQPDGPWASLLERGLRILKSQPALEGRWTLGGGTVLMFRYAHRRSKDIDIFFDDPQLLGYVSPRLNDMADAPDYDEQAKHVKLRYPEGEVDFIVAPDLLGLPTTALSFQGHEVPCEHPLEIVAKKVAYRHEAFAVRDFFDLATVLGEHPQEADRLGLPLYARALLKRFPEGCALDVLPGGRDLLTVGMPRLRALLEELVRGRQGKEVDVG